MTSYDVAMATNFDVIATAITENPGGVQCCLQWNEIFKESSTYENDELVINVVGIFTPLLLIAILHTIIYFKLKTQIIPGEQSANARQQRARRERIVLKMAIAIVLGFAVCWVPFSIVLILIHFVTGIWSCGFQHFRLVANFMAISNCAINPCICFIFSTNYRQSLRTILRCL